jgi:hypothetical protein
MTEEEQWIDDNKRRDGLSIMRGIDDFVIMPQGEGLPVDKCPCCEKPFLNRTSARRVADFLFPMETSDAASD